MNVVENKKVTFIFIAVVQRTIIMLKMKGEKIMLLYHSSSSSKYFSNE